MVSRKLGYKSTLRNSFVKDIKERSKELEDYLLETFAQKRDQQLANKEQPKKDLDPNLEKVFAADRHKNFGELANSPKFLCLSAANTFSRLGSKSFLGCSLFANC